MSTRGLLAELCVGGDPGDEIIRVSFLFSRFIPYSCLVKKMQHLK
jgi:hypothetical protein